MDHEVQAAPFLFDLGEYVVHGRQIENVAGLDDLGADRLGQRQGAAAESTILIGERKLGALTSQSAGNAPGDRAIVGDAHDQAALAGHQRPWFGYIEIGHSRPLTRTRSLTAADLEPALAVLVNSHTG